MVSHRSAARLHGLPGFESVLNEFTLPDGVNFGRRTEVTLHHTNLLPAHHIVRIDGIPTTSLARTLLDLTAVTKLGRAARAMDTALGRGRVTYWELLKMLADVTARGRRRTRRFRLLLEERGQHYRPTESELEKQFDLLAARLCVVGWDRQVDLGDEEGWIGRVDFFHREGRVVLELDGKAAHSSFIDTQNDAERDRRLRAAGFQVLRFGWAQVLFDADALIETLRAAVTAS